MAGWLSPLFFLLAKSSEHQLRCQIDFLKAENEMLRTRVPKKRIILKEHERERLLKLGEPLGAGSPVKEWPARADTYGV